MGISAQHATALGNTTASAGRALATAETSEPAEQAVEARPLKPGRLLPVWALMGAVSGVYGNRHSESFRPLPLNALGTAQVQSRLHRDLIPSRT
jgi:hypothetical protein